ncbi:MAG TPA: FecR domain-containing protein [Polyangiaceae bacterium]|nr:FecR domain-containing protein [Polyangiaceae bacterium]
MTKLAELGRLVAQQQDLAEYRRRRDPQAAQRFARTVAHDAPPRSKRPGFVWAAAAAAITVLSVGVWRFHATSSANPSPALAAAGERVVARDGQKLPLGFPDGSQMVLTSGAEATVQELSDTGAKVQLGSGEAAFSVRHQARTNWLVGAGPYRVRVTGTRFAVSWAPARERFELRLDQGSVVVTSDSGSHAAVTMIAPQALVIDHGGWSLAPSAPSVAPPEEPAEAPIPDPADSAATSAMPAPSSAVAHAPQAPSAPQAPAWETLALTGKYRAAYEDASNLGIAHLSDAQSSRALLSLAEVCRFSGHAAEATQVLTRLRTRFARSDDAATAAFQLGRVSNDATAVTWFRTYLAERPNGALAREAAGRLLEVLNRSGDRSGARAAARAYLDRYPNGPHAAFARQLLTE